MKYLATLILSSFFLVALGQKLSPKLNEEGKAFEERIIEFSENIERPFDAVSISLFSIFSGFHSIELLKETPDIHIYKIIVSPKWTSTQQIHANLSVQIKPGKARIYVTNMIYAEPGMDSATLHRDTVEDQMKRLFKQVKRPLLTLNQLLDQVEIEEIDQEW